MKVAAIEPAFTPVTMARPVAKKACSIHFAKLVFTSVLVLAGLSFLAGCQGVSTGGSQQQTTTLSLNISTLSFGSVQAGTTKTLTFTASNSGPDSVSVSGVSFSSKYFALTSPTLPVTVSSGQSVPVSVEFSPNAAGAFTATATVASDASDTSTALTLSGTGTSAPVGDLSSSPSSEAFGNVAVGSQQPQTFTLTNNGSGSVNISQVAITGTGFQLSGITTPLTLANSQSTTFQVTFAPQAAGAASGSVTVTSDASNPSLSISLSGTGTETTSTGQLSVSPTTLALGSVVVGTSGSASGSLTASGASVTVASASTNNAAFSVSGLTLPATITAGQSLPFTVTFTPTSAAAATATLSFANNTATSPTTEALTGTGEAAPTYDVALSWNASTSSNISGYNVYRAVYNNSSCGSFAKINPSLGASTSYTDSVVTDGTAYCYYATAMTSSNQESAPSNIVSDIQIPAP